MKFRRMRMYIDAFGLGLVFQINTRKRVFSVGIAIGYFQYFFLLEFPRSAEEE